MSNVKHPELMNKKKLLKALQSHSRRELAMRWDVPYNSINHQIRTKFSEEERNLILRNRLSFTDEEKLAFLLDAEETSISEVARVNGISRTQIQHWKKQLFEKGLYDKNPTIGSTKVKKRTQRSA